MLSVTGPGFGGTFSGDPTSTSANRPQVPTVPARGSQKWKLDPLGNWKEFAIDIYTSSSNATPDAAFDGASGFVTEEFQTRAHNSANELGSITVPSTLPTLPTGSDFVAAPARMPMTYTHDDAGNRLTADNGLSGGSQRKHKFIYDAWNRLVRIDKYDSTGSDWDAIAAYRYNGLHWRTRKFVHSTPDALTGKETVFTYNASWQAIVEEIDEVDRLVQQVFGLRAVNDAIYRREDHKHEVPAVTEYDPELDEYVVIEPAYTLEADGTFDKSF